jgi:hypothetical protein
METLTRLKEQAEKDLETARLYRQAGWDAKEHLKRSGKLIDQLIDFCEELISRYEATE